MDIVLATGNAGKVREIMQMLAGQTLAGQRQIVARPQSDFEVEDVEETGLSFVENAILKARNAAYITGLPAIADDSGLEVDWLQGAPGIYSARFAGPGANDADNVQKLLRELADAPDDKRTARFRCVMVCLRHATDPTPLVCQGTWEGMIGTELAGDNGFGYDPIFHVPDLNCMAAELSPQVKNKLSHRGQALQQLAAGFAQHMGLK